MKMIAVFDLPDDFKGEGGYAYCHLYEKQGEYRVFDRIVNLKPTPERQEIYDRLYRWYYVSDRNPSYKSLKKVVRDCLDEILGD